MRYRRWARLISFREKRPGPSTARMLRIRFAQDDGWENKTWLGSKKIRPFRQRFEHRGSRVDGEVVGTAGRAKAADLGEILFHGVRVALPDFVRFDEELLIGFKIAQFDEPVYSLPMKRDPP